MLTKCQKITSVKYLPRVRPRMFPKSKMLRNYWNVMHVMSGVSRSRYWYQILFLLNITSCSTQIGPKNKSAQDLLKFDTFDSSNMSISILMSKIIFIKPLQPVRPKLIPEMKMLRIYWNLEHLIFRISQSRLWC